MGRSLVATLLFAGACSAVLDDGAPTWEEFRARTPRDPVTQMYLVDGDLPVQGERLLREYYDSLYHDEGVSFLSVATYAGQDLRWWSEARNLTYCVSDGFGAQKGEIVEAIRQASDEGWERFAGVNFIYRPDQDHDCDDLGSQVLFRVVPAHADYFAMAFFPYMAAEYRFLRVSTKTLPMGQDSFFGTDRATFLRGVMGHELGHILGFRHEQTHSRAMRGHCWNESHPDFGSSSLTPYDPSSIMHYPWCGGITQVGTILDFTARDAEGAKALYGPPVVGADPVEPEVGASMKFQVSDTVYQGGFKLYGPFFARLGSAAHVSLRRLGDEVDDDADLYVQMGRVPTLQDYSCRPFLDHSNEHCYVGVLEGRDAIYVKVFGYGRRSSYALEVEYQQP